jgi:hypothetical protein
VLTKNRSAPSPPLFDVGTIKSFSTLLIISSWHLSKHTTPSACVKTVLANQQAQPFQNSASSRFHNP